MYVQDEVEGKDGDNYVDDGSSNNKEVEDEDENEEEDEENGVCC